MNPCAPGVGLLQYTYKTEERGTRTGKTAIVAEELTKYYGKARGIGRLSLSVAQGEFFGFIALNGAGKSTTIRTQAPA